MRPSTLCRIATIGLAFLPGCTNEIALNPNPADSKSSLQTPGLPLTVVETDSVSIQTPRSVLAFGKISLEGGAPVIEKGFCWKLNGLPTIEDAKIQVSLPPGQPNGSFRAVIEGLRLGTNYQVRAYAKSIVGTSYGAPLSFASPACEFKTTGDVFKDTVNVYYRLVGTWELFETYASHTSIIEGDELAHHSTHSFYCYDRPSLVFKSDRSVLSISQTGTISDLGKFYVIHSPDNFLRLQTPNKLLDANILFFDDGGFRLWNWTNVVPGKFADYKASNYLKRY